MFKSCRVLFLLLSMFVFSVSLAQNKEISIRSSCFSDGETSTVSDILAHPTITLSVVSSLNDAELVSYNCAFPAMDKDRNPAGVTASKNRSFGFNEESIALIEKLQPGETFSIRDIMVEVTNKRTRKKETIELPPVTLKVGSASSRQCGEKKAEGLIDYNGKLLTGKNHNTPVTNQKVILQDQAEAELQSAITDNYGDFKFTNLHPDQAYKINVSSADDTKIKDNVLYAAKPDGTVIRTFNKTNKGFVYELLPAELNSLTRETEEDTQFKIKKFSSSAAAELTVIENIYYDVNSAEIKPESVEKLDKIIASMQENNGLKLLIASHTDSKGDDAYNLTLSEKRAQKVMEYFILQGIDKSRLTAKGMGESQIMNRCKNGVDCSELEMQLNRRTEFKFTK
jgi:outer membrane protein OmpA-like peptidoglycan-associated protein